jgi:hypothetical protein
MTLYADTYAISSESFTAENSADHSPSVFVGGWAAAHDFVAYCPSEPETIKPRHDAENTDTNIFAPQTGLGNKVGAFRARRRLNRAFRRDQAAFEHAMDAVVHDPAGQRELQSIWTSRR